MKRTKNIRKEKNAGWESLAGFSCVRGGQYFEDCCGASMAYAESCIYQVRWKHLERYDVKNGQWHNYPGVLVLPEITGIGAGITYDGTRYLYITRGGRLGDFYRFDIRENKMEPVKPLDYSRPIGIGSRITYGNGYVYCLRGDESPDFSRYDVQADKWEDLPPVNDSMSSLYIGKRCTGLVYVDGYLLAWPDHHVRCFDEKKGAWNGCFACTFRPSVDGGMTAYDGHDYVYMVQGGISMTLGRLDVKKRRFAYLEPRLPDTVSVPGNRLTIVRTEGQEYLYVCRGHDTHEFWRIGTRNLKEICVV